VYFSLNCPYKEGSAGKSAKVKKKKSRHEWVNELKNWEHSSFTDFWIYLYSAPRNVVATFTQSVTRWHFRKAKFVKSCNNRKTSYHISGRSVFDLKNELEEIIDYIPRWEVFHSCRELR
jgi:hypothetical protein